MQEKNLNGWLGGENQGFHRAFREVGWEGGTKGAGGDLECCGDGSCNHGRANGCLSKNRCVVVVTALV